MVEPEKGVSGRNIGGLQLGWAGLVLNKDCDIREAVAKGFGDGLPGLVHELFESGATHRLWLTPLHLYNNREARSVGPCQLSMPGVAPRPIRSIFHCFVSFMRLLCGHSQSESLPLGSPFGMQ